MIFTLESAIITQGMNKNFRKMSTTKSCSANLFEDGFASYASASTRKVERGHVVKSTLNIAKSNTTDNSQNTKNTTAKSSYFRWNSK